MNVPWRWSDVERREKGNNLGQRKKYDQKQRRLPGIYQEVSLLFVSLLIFLFLWFGFTITGIQGSWRGGWEVIEKVGWSQAVESLCFLWRVGEAIEGFWLARDRVIAGLQEDTPSTGVFQTWLWKVLEDFSEFECKINYSSSFWALIWDHQEGSHFTWSKVG